MKKSNEIKSSEKLDLEQVSFIEGDVIFPLPTYVTRPRIERAVKSNRDLPRQFIEDTLVSVEEAKAGQISGYQSSGRRSLNNLAALADDADAAAKRAAAASDDMLDFVAASEARIEAMEISERERI